MSAKVCPACQKKFFDGSVFCDNCGTQLVDEQPEAQPPVNQQPPVYAQQPANQPPVYGQPYAQPAYAPVVMVKPRIPGRGLGITSMVLGIIAAVGSLGLISNCVDFVDKYKPWGSRKVQFYEELLTGGVSDYDAERHDNVSASIVIFILAVLSLVFGIVSLAKGFKKGQSISGIILSSVAIVVGVIGLVLLFSV